MRLPEVNYYKATTIAAVYGTILSSSSIVGLSIFLSYLMEDPTTVDLFVDRYEISGGSNVTDVKMADVADKEYFSMSLILHFLWFQASAMLFLGNKRNTVVVILTWMVMSSLVIITDILGTVYSITTLLLAISWGSNVHQSIIKFLIMFAIFSKFGYVLHLILAILLYFTAQRVNQIQKGKRKKQKSHHLDQKDNPPISTIESGIAHNAESNILHTKREFDGHPRGQSTHPLTSPIGERNESAQHGSHSLESGKVEHQVDSTNFIRSGYSNVPSTTLG